LPYIVGKINFIENDKVYLFLCQYYLKPTKMKYVSFLPFLFFLLWNQPATGRDIFVSMNGNDENPGTQYQPVASLNGAVTLIRQFKSHGLKDDFRIIVGKGTYLMSEPLVLLPEDSGTDEAPLVITTELDAHPVFIGGFPVKNWEKVSDKLWRARVPEAIRYGLRFEQLYVNGAFATRAKSPNNGFYFLNRVEETSVSQSTEKVSPMAIQKITLPNGAMQVVKNTNPKDLDETLVVFYHKWDNTRKRISAVDIDSSAVYVSGEGMEQWNKLDTKTRFIIENSEAALDTCGEWYLNRDGYLYYMPKEGETIENTKIYAPLTSHFVVIKGDEKSKQLVKNIHIENLTFAVSSYHTPYQGNEPAQAASPVEATIMADFASNIELTNCEISQTGTNAIWFRSSCMNCKVSQCYLHDLGAGGVKIGSIQIPVDENDLTRNILVDNNIIRTGGFVFPCAVGVTIFQASDNKITHNEIANFRYSGISVGWVWGYSPSPTKRNTIEFNHIHHLGWGELCDMGGVYCLGASEGTTVSNNVIHHVYSFDYGGWGLYTDEGSTGIVMENNLVYACKNSGFHQHYGKSNIIRNNIFAANLRAQLQATRIEDHLSFTFTNNIVWFNSGTLLSSNWSKINLKSDNNCYWDTRTKDIKFDQQSFTEWKSSGKDRNSIIADPSFVNPKTFNFHLKNKGSLKRIEFKPFEYEKAGVYGSSEWKSLAAFDSKLAQLFDEVVASREKSVPKR
jgi:hypothetical protein